MAANQTTNYQLNQWEATDQILRTDFNADNAKVDAALKALSDQVVQKANQSALNTVISAVNQKADASTFTGTGTSGSGNPTRITFSHLPVLFLILGGTITSSFWAFGSKDMPYLYMDFSQSNMSYDVDWNGNQVSFYASQPDWQFNDSRTTYYVFALFAEDE